MSPPSQQEVIRALRNVKRTLDQIGAWGDDGTCDVRLQVYPSGEWAMRWGDSQYDQDHRGFWGSSSIDKATTLSDMVDIADALIDDVNEAIALDDDDGTVDE